MNLRTPTLFIASAGALLLACAHTAPRELVDARAAYARAADGPAKDHTPAELHVARDSLIVAERAFTDDGDTVLVRDQAYIAQRKAELAEVLAQMNSSLPCSPPNTRLPTFSGTGMRPMRVPSGW